MSEQPEELYYCVITDDGTGDGDGGMCDDLALMVAHDLDTRFPIYTTEFSADMAPDNREDWLAHVIYVKRPVFFTGELIVVNGYGREVVGCGRKPQKWHIGYELYADFLPALARARQVTQWGYGGCEGPLPPPEVEPLEVETVESRRAYSEALCAAIANMPVERLMELPLAKQLADALTDSSEPHEPQTED